MFFLYLENTFYGKTIHVKTGLLLENALNHSPICDLFVTFKMLEYQPPLLKLY